MKSFLTKSLSLVLVCALLLSTAILFACVKDGPCTGCEEGCDECRTILPPEPDEISYYKMPDSFWLNLSYPEGEICNFIKFKGEHNGKSYDLYYFDSIKHFVPTKTCIIKITDGVFGRYEWQPDDGDLFRWVRIGFNIDEKTAGKDAYALFGVLFRGQTDQSVPESVTVDGKTVSCNRFSQESSSGESSFWRPDGYDFWIKCHSYDLSGNFFEISALTVDLQLSALPEFMVLPF